MKTLIYSLLILALISCKKETTTTNTTKTNSITSVLEENYLDPIKFNSKLNYGTLTDIDGNIYKTIKIGDQIWMAENLKVSRYNDGKLIPNIQVKNTWANDTIGAWCNYDNDTRYDKVYGKLYNTYVIATNKVCPSGWHIPSSIEWDNMFFSFSKAETFTDALIEEDTSHWKYGNLIKYDNLNNTYNKSGFTALPSGYIAQGKFSGLRYEKTFLQEGNWWTSDTTIYNNKQALKKGWHLTASLQFNWFGNKQQMGFQDLGIAIRCIKD